MSHYATDVAYLIYVEGGERRIATVEVAHEKGLDDAKDEGDKRVEVHALQLVV